MGISGNGLAVKPQHPYKTMVHYDICQNSHHNEPLSCMGAKASQPTHFLKFQLTGFRLSEINCIVHVHVLSECYIPLD